MTEEQKVPTPVTTNFNPPMTFEAQIPRMSWGQLKGECRKLARRPKLEGAEATVLSVAVFNDVLNINDPYCAQQKNQTKKTYDLYHTKGLK